MDIDFKDLTSLNFFLEKDTNIQRKLEIHLGNFFPYQKRTIPYHKKVTNKFKGFIKSGNGPNSASSTKSSPRNSTKKDLTTTR